MWTWSLYLSFSLSIFLKILSHGNYFLAEGESWILSICVTAILFSLFRLLCILPVSKVIPFFGLRNFLSLFILDWRLKSCAQISLFFFLASSIRYLVEAGGIVPMLLVSTRHLPLTLPSKSSLPSSWILGLSSCPRKLLRFPSFNSFILWIHTRSLCLHLTLFAKNDRFANFPAIKTKDLIILSPLSHLFWIGKKLDLLLIALDLRRGQVSVLTIQPTDHQGQRVPLTI